MHTAERASRVGDAHDAREANAAVVAWLEPNVGAQVGADVALGL